MTRLTRSLRLSGSMNSSECCRSYRRAWQPRLFLHRVAGYSVQEVGDELGVSRETAKKYLARAVEHCRNLRATQGAMKL